MGPGLRRGDNGGNPDHLGVLVVKKLFFSAPSPLPSPHREGGEALPRALPLHALRGVLDGDAHA